MKRQTITMREEKGINPFDAPCRSISSTKYANAVPFGVLLEFSRAELALREIEPPLATAVTHDVKTNRRQRAEMDSRRFCRTTGTTLFELPSALSASVASRNSPGTVVLAGRAM
jgi:hypothetical protein